MDQTNHPADHPNNYINKEETPKVHPAIALLIAHMDSRPEKFYRYQPGRRGTVPNPQLTEILNWTDNFKQFWNREEKRLFNEKLREIRMQEMHTRLMADILIK